MSGAATLAAGLLGAIAPLTVPPAAGHIAEPGRWSGTLAGPTRAVPRGAISIGAGSRPGVAVDAAGTAYIAWNGPEPTNSLLHFCLLPRGATGCSAGVASTLPAPATTTSGSRPFVTVYGSRVVVVQYRYPTSGSVARGVYRFTSMDRGLTFLETRLVGSVAFEDNVQGPADTVSGVPINGEMAFQNVALTGDQPLNPDGTSAVPQALLSTTHQNQAAVGLLDAGTPLVVVTNGDSAQMRQYDGSGSLNDSANWTAPVDVLGTTNYPRLAGGPTGLFMLSGTQNGNLRVNKWVRVGQPSVPAVSIGPGSSPYKDMYQDASGRLHAVFQRDSANPLQIIHATSDDGTHWRQGTLVTQEIAANGGITDLSVAVAPDHVGVVVWHAGLGAGDIRVAGLGPDAPVDALFATSPSALRVSNTGTFKYSFVSTPGKGKISLTSTKKVRVGSSKKFVTIPAKAFTATKPGTVRVTLKLSAKNLSALERVHKLPCKITVVRNGKRFRTALTLKAP